MKETSELENPSNVSIRPVNWGDSSLLLSWRNNSDVRNWSRDSTEIDDVTHEKWFRAWMSNQQQQGYFFVIEHLGRPAGMIRFDMKAHKLFEVSVLIESNFRGKGVAKSAIKVAINHIRDASPEFVLIAAIHERNLASINLFSGLGFQKSGKSGDFLEFSRNFFFGDV